MFVRFLDDNDPRLLFLVTYHEPSSTTYMKVVKIEKSKNKTQFELSEEEKENPFAQYMNKLTPRTRGFSFAENQPIIELKKEIMSTQMSTDQSVNPNGIDNITAGKK